MTDHLKRARAIYCKYGPSEVYKYANKQKIKYSFCQPCAALTPTIKNTCLLCESNKNHTR